MKRKFKLVVLLLTVALVLTFIPTSIFASDISSVETTENSVNQDNIDFDVTPNENYGDLPILGEIVSRREENTKHFDLGNGVYQAITYGTPIHRLNSAGVWQDIDNRLFPNSDSSGYSTLDGRTQMAINVSSTEPLISLHENGYSISMFPMTRSLQTSSSAEIVNHAVNEINDLTINEAARVSNTTYAKYSEVFTSTDIEYVLESNDIKENIIVKSPRDSYVYSFKLTVDNLVPKLQQSGNIVFIDEQTAEKKYNIPAPYMYDKDGVISYDVHYELTEVKDSYIITITADSDWVNALDRAFPVTIDPTIKKATVFDTYIDSATPTDPHGTAHEMWISSSQISFINSSLPSIPTECQFHSANLFVYFYYNSSVTTGGLYAGAYQVKHSWDEDTLTWNIAKPNTTTYISSQKLSQSYMSGAIGAYTGSPQKASFNVTEAVESWYANTSPNYGIALKYESGTNRSVKLKTFESPQDYRSYYVITYIEPTIISGVYRIKNASNGLYLDVRGGGTVEGTAVQQYSAATSSNTRNQLFKITFIKTFGSTEQLNYYSIRPMTNSGLGLETATSGSSRNATIEDVPTVDVWDYFAYNNLWAIYTDGTNYIIKNGSLSATSYLTAPSNSTNGASVYTSDTISSHSKWILEPYTGDAINGILWNDTPTKILTGKTYWCNAGMYSSVIGSNGPVTYKVGNTDYSTTNKASIDANTGMLVANSSGTIKIGVTYAGAPWVWWRTVEIKYSGCRPYLDINETGDDYYDEMNCHGYALNSIANLPSNIWLPAQIHYNVTNSVYQTSNEYLYAIKPYFEQWMDQNIGSSKWEDVTELGGIDAELNTNQWLVVMRAGVYPNHPVRNCRADYHFWYRTNTGEWVNKHGYGSYSEKLGDDLPTDDDSIGWNLHSSLPGYYDSDLVYYRITE